MVIAVPDWHGAPRQSKPCHASATGLTAKGHRSSAVNNVLPSRAMGIPGSKIGRKRDGASPPRAEIETKHLLD
jgi:hypothetical protein